MTDDEYLEYKNEIAKLEEMKRELKNSFSEEVYQELVKDEEGEKTRAELNELWPDGEYNEFLLAMLMAEEDDDLIDEYDEDDDILDESQWRSPIAKEKREKGEHLTIFQRMSFFRGPFNRRKMFFYGLVVPFILFFIGIASNQAVASLFNISNTDYTLGIFLIIILLFLASAIQRAKDLAENRYFIIIALFIPIVNLVVLFDLFFEKGWGDYDDYI